MHGCLRYPVAPIVASHLLYYSADQFQAPVKLMESVQEKDLGWMGVHRVQLKLFARKWLGKGCH